MSISAAQPSTAPLDTERDVLQECTTRILDRLPPGWSGTRFSDAALGAPSVDLVVTVRSPEGTPVDLVIEAKRLVERRDVAPLAESLATATATFSNAVGVVASRYLAPTVRESLEARGLSYVDATGNIRLLSSVPGLFLRDRGADNDPWRGPGRPRGTLKGAPASRVVRSLLDLPGSWTVRDLIAVSGASTGATYRVLNFLERQEIVERDHRGVVTIPSWRALLELWSRDYGFIRSSTVSTFIAPRGLPTLLGTIATTPTGDHAVTGTAAAAAWAPYAPARNAMIYVANAAQAAATWGLRATDSGVNVLLAEPESDIVFARSLTTTSGLVVAPPAQVAVDLLTGPGRGPEEARELIEWMERNESSWRN